nr:uncharacterized protein LOC113827666 [Penaeus vannamei]
MGQTYSAMRGSQSAVLGEVVVGLEALAMLESPEEHSSTVMRMASPQIPLHKGQLTPSAKGGSGRVRRALGITEEEDEDEDEAGEKEGPFSSPVPSLRRTQQKRRVEIPDQLADVVYSVLHLRLPPEGPLQLASSPLLLLLLLLLLPSLLLLLLLLLPPPPPPRRRRRRRLPACAEKPKGRS